MKLIYFTATGNSLYVAKQFGGELLSIPQLMKEKKFDFEDDKIGIISPCYFFGLPRIVKRFISRVNLKADYIFVIMTYGNMCAGGLDQMIRAIQKRHVRLSYANKVMMIDNYLPMFDVETQIKTVGRKRIEKHIIKISDDVDSEVKKIKKSGFFSRVLTRFAQKIYDSKTGYADTKFIVNDNCNSCKTCENICPVGNIKVEDKPKYKHNCEVCYACIHNCPENAIHLKEERSEMRFINEHIELKDIIKANNQN